MSLWQFMAVIDGWNEAHKPPETKGGSMSKSRFEELRQQYG